MQCPLEWLMNTVYFFQITSRTVESESLRSSLFTFRFDRQVVIFKNKGLCSFHIYLIVMRSLPDMYSCIVGTTPSISEFRERCGGSTRTGGIFLTRTKLKIWKAFLFNLWSSNFQRSKRSTYVFVFLAWIAVPNCHHKGSYWKNRRTKHLKWWIKNQADILPLPSSFLKIKGFLNWT